MEDEVVVQVDANARADAIREKISVMLENGYLLLGPKLDLPEGTRVRDAMTLVFKRRAFTEIEAPGLSGPDSNIQFGGGTFRNDGPGAGLSAGPR